MATAYSMDTHACFFVFTTCVCSALSIIFCLHKYKLLVDKAQRCRGTTLQPHGIGRFQLMTQNTVGPLQLDCYSWGGEIRAISQMQR